MNPENPSAPATVPAGRREEAGGRQWIPYGAALALWLGLAGMVLHAPWRAWVGRQTRWAVEPLFHDWHVVRLGWLAHLDGVDPLAASSQPFNYPRFVLLGAELGARVPPNLAGLISAGLFLGVLAWILRPRSRGQACLAGLLIVSPPVCLLIERGNLDAWAFLLVVLGLAVLSKPSWGKPGAVLGSLSLWVAAMVKLFPVVVLPVVAVFWRGTRGILAAVGFVAWVGWLVGGTDEVRLILEKTTRGLEPAYGRMIAGSRYWVEHVMAPGNAAPNGVSLSFLMRASLVGCAAGFVLAGVAGWRWRSRVWAVPAPDRERLFFCAGALIYGGTFLLGNNWSYRLVFVLLCVPLLWRAAEGTSLRVLGAAGLAGIAVVLLPPFHLPWVLFVVQQIVAWLLAWLLAGGAVGVMLGAPRTCAERPAA